MNTQIEYQNELKVIGDKIESIAKQLKSDGDLWSSEALHKLGDEVEHFFDHTAGTSSSVVDTDFPVS